MKTFFTLFMFLFLSIYSMSQYNGTQSFTLTSSPINNTHNSGQVVTLFYTMNGYSHGHITLIK